MAQAKGEKVVKTRLWRPRTFIYLSVIGLVCAVMAYALSTRKTFDANVLHERSPVYVELSGNRIRNGYTLKILNMVRQEGHYRLTLEELEGATMTVIRTDGEGSGLGGFDDCARRRRHFPAFHHRAQDVAQEGKKRFGPGLDQSGYRQDHSSSKFVCGA